MVALIPPVKPEFFFSGASNDIIDKLNDLSKRLTEENIADSNVGTLTLNAIKRLVAERAKNDHEEVKSHPRSKAKDQVTVDSLMGEISGLLRKLRPKAGMLSFFAFTLKVYLFHMPDAANL